MGKELNFREREVLRIIVEIYTEEGKLSNSFSVAGRLPFRMSPSAVRQVMASLETKGYLSLSTRKGRFPTNLALKIYINNLIRVKPWRQVEGKFQMKTSEDMNLMIKEAAALLSEESQNLSLLVSPSIFYVPFSHVSFIRVQENTFLLLLRSLKGLIITKTIRIDRDYTQNKLDEISNILEKFKGRTLREVMDFIEEGIYRGSRSLKEIIRKMRELVGEGDLYVEGESLIFERLRGNLEKIKGILKIFEEKKEVLKFLNKLELGGKIEVVWGEQIPFPYGKDCVFLLYPYLPKGVMAVFGPKNMSYSKSLAALDNLGGYLRSVIY